MKGRWFRVWAPLVGFFHSSAECVCGAHQKVCEVFHCVALRKSGPRICAEVTSILSDTRDCK